MNGAVPVGKQAAVDQVFQMDLTFPDRADWNLSRILSIQAARFEGKTFLRQPEGGTYSYREVDQTASRIARTLVGRGFLPGDRLMIYLDNCPEFVLAWFGATRAGVVEVPTNTDYFGDLLRHCLHVAAPKGIVLGARFAERFCQVSDAVGDLAPTIFVLGEGSSEAIAALRSAGLAAEHFDALLAGPPEDPGVHQARHELTAILFTSGTTGPSKGVMMSHAQTYFFSDQCVNLVRLTTADVYMTSNTLFHANAQFLTVYPALIAGASVVLYERFSSSQFSRRIAESGATVTNFLGVMMDWVAKQPPEPTDAQSRLRCVFAVPTAWTLADDLKRRFGLEAIVECFGQTEISLPLLTPYGIERPVGAVGVPVADWFEIRLADPETDDEVPFGQVGELQLRPKEPWIVSSGYFGMPEATAEARRNLWLHTGDGLRRDDQGWFYFTDRFKDCLRRRGENISSYEVEKPVLLHPAVATCAAVGVPAGEDAGEDEVALFVVAAPGASISPQEIAAWSGARLPPFLVPRYVAVVEQLPMTPSGKIRKAELRRRGVSEAWDRLAVQAAAGGRRSAG